MAITIEEMVDSYVPRFGIQIAWDTAAGTSAVGRRDIFILAEKTAAGTALSNQVSGAPFGDADEGEKWFGANSVGAYLVHQALRGSRLKSGRVWGIAVDEPAGVAASQTITVVGTATSNGVFTVRIGGVVLRIQVFNGYIVGTTAALLKSKFDELSLTDRPPLTTAISGASSEICTYTAGNKGASFNTMPIKQVITGEEPTGQTLTIGGATLAGGSLEPTLTTALQNVLGVKTPWMVVPWIDTTVLIAVKDHVKDKSDAESMVASKFLCAKDDTVANLTSHVDIVDSNDAERGFCLGIEKSDSWHAAFPAWGAAAIASEKDVVKPLDDIPLPYALAPDPGDVFTGAGGEQDTLLTGGVTPLVVKDKRVVISRLVSMRTTLGVPWDNSVVEGLDYYRDELHASQQKFKGMKIAPDGTPPEEMDDNTITPQSILDDAYGVSKSAAMIGVLRDVDKLWPQAKAELSGTNVGQVNYEVPGAVLWGVHVLGGKIREKRGVVN